MKLDDLLAAPIVGANRQCLYYNDTKSDPLAHKPAGRSVRKGERMTPTQRARRSDAIYYDTLSRRELCDRIAFLEDENAELAILRTKMEQAALRRETVEFKGVLYTPEGLA